jgi:hypothetical protein
VPIRIFETGVLLGIAADAARSIEASPRDGGQKGALISIVFAVVALEAFLNETTELALDFSKYPQGLALPVISVFAEFMVEAEKSHASLESKFLLGNWILTGKKLDKGTQIYQDFSLLLQLRNDLLHFKANDAFEQSAPPEEIHKKLFNRFGNKNILAENAKYSDGSWTFLIETRAVAEWACRTAAQTLLDFCSKVPQGMLKVTLSHFVRAFDAEKFFRTGATQG